MQLLMENWRTFIEQEANTKYDESSSGPPIKSVDEFEEHLKNLHAIILEGVEKNYFLLTEAESAHNIAAPTGTKPTTDLTPKQTWIESLKGALSRGLQFITNLGSLGVKAFNKVIKSLADLGASLLEKLPVGARKIMNKEMNTLANSLQEVVISGLQGLEEEWSEERSAFKEAAIEQGIWPSNEDFLARIKQNEQEAIKWFWQTHGKKTLQFAKDWTQESRRERAAVLESAAIAKMQEKSEEVSNDWEKTRTSAQKSAKSSKTMRILEVGTGGFIFGAMDNGGGDVISKVFVGDNYYNMLVDAGWSTQAALESNFAMLNTGSDLIGGMLAALIATSLIRYVAKKLNLPGAREAEAKEGGMAETTMYIVIGCMVMWVYTTLSGAPWGAWLAATGLMEEQTV